MRSGRDGERDASEPKRGIRLVLPHQVRRHRLVVCREQFLGGLLNSYYRTGVPTQPDNCMVPQCYLTTTTYPK
jgi:hypothetical protein